MREFQKNKTLVMASPGQGLTSVLPPFTAVRGAGLNADCICTNSAKVRAAHARKRENTVAAQVSGIHCTPKALKSQHKYNWICNLRNKKPILTLIVVCVF